MKIDIEFLGFPMFSDMVGDKKLELDIAGQTVKDLIHELIKRYGREARDSFYDTQGNFDPMIQISLNGNIIPSKEHDTPLNEGDSLIFMILLAGG